MRVAFVRRKIDLTFQLGKGSFGADGSDTVKLTGLRCSAAVTKPGGASLSELNLRVYGMSLDVMNKLTIIGQLIAQQNYRFNQVTVTAGDDTSGMAVAFVGNILEAWVDASSAPDVAFICRANTGYGDQMTPVPPTSYQGTVDAAVVMQDIAARMMPARSLENSGVSVQIANPYLAGTLLDQARAVARAGDFNCILDDHPELVVAIWPNGGTRQGVIPLISADTGMVGYPTHTQSAISFETLYNPSLINGGQVMIDSLLKPACGKWNIYNIGHDLEAETPGGKWFTRCDCSILGAPVPIADA